VLFAALTVVNIVALLATASIWLSFFGQRDSIPQFGGAGDMLDAVRSHAIEYEVRSYSRPLEYDAVARKAVVRSHGDQEYVGPPSLKIDAAWTDLLRGKKCIFWWSLNQPMRLARLTSQRRPLRGDDNGRSQIVPAQSHDSVQYGQMFLRVSSSVRP
jgi:hypothetical protein